MGEGDEGVGEGRAMEVSSIKFRWIFIQERRSALFACLWVILGIVVLHLAEGPPFFDVL